MYHESSICNLLEVLLYHRTACESSEDALVELIDYCYRKFLMLHQKSDYYFKLQTTGMPEKDPKDVLKQTPEQELQKQSDDIEFSSAMIALSLIRFISDHIQDLAVPIVHQMMETNDIPCALVPLLEFKPWLRKNFKGEMEKFEDQRWVVIPKAEG